MTPPTIHEKMTFDFTQLKKICELAGINHKEMAALLKITRPTFYLWCRGGKPQTLATYESALQTLRAVKRGLQHGDFPLPADLTGDERAFELAKRYAKNYVAE